MVRAFRPPRIRSHRIRSTVQTLSRAALFTLLALPLAITGCGNDASSARARSVQGTGDDAPIHGRKDTTPDMTDSTRTADRPALDARAPAVIRTATFALG